MLNQYSHKTCVRLNKFRSCTRDKIKLAFVVVEVKMFPVTSVNQTGLFLSNAAGRQLLLKAVNRVWTELMHSKRQMLEDIFKVSLPCNDRGHVDIATARPALEEPALKSWQNHLGEQRLNFKDFLNLNVSSARLSDCLDRVVRR